MQKNKNIVKAINKNVRSSPRKINILLKNIRGKKADIAIRDLSFSLTEVSNSKNLQETLLNYKNNILKETYIFDFFHNKAKNELKIGFRFTFQAHTKTLKDSEIDLVMQDIINQAYKIKSVSVPGLIR